MRCARFADALERAAGRRERDTPGAGAAGGVGFAMLALAGQFAELELRPGVDLVMEEAGFDRALATSQLVITGEGRIDAQTAYGKTALGVAKRAQAAGKPCIAVGGGVTPEGDRRAGRGRRDRRARRRDAAGPSRPRWPRARRRSSGAASESRGCSARRWASPPPRRTSHERRARRSGDPERPRGTTGRGEAEEAGEEARPPQARSGQGVGQLPPTLPAGAAPLRPRRADRGVRRAGLGVAPRPDERADPHDPHPEHRRRERGEGVRGAADGVPQRPRAGGPQARHRLGRRRAVDRAAAGLGEGRVRAAARAHRRHPAGRPRAPEGAPPPGDAAPHPRAARRLLARVPRRRCRRSRRGTGSPPSTASARRPPRSCCCSASGRR